MSAHTKGPWRCALMTPYQESALVKAERGTVAWIHADDTEEVEGRIVEVLSAEFRANARLIAAAPDLLEALDECFGMLMAYEGNGDPGAEAKVAKARAAIKKARGEG